MSTESLKEDGRPAQQWYWDDWFSEFGLRLCSLAARGLWIDMLGIMFSAEIRGTLMVNGKQIDNKALTKLVGDTTENINKYISELEEHDVFSKFENGTIYSRRMYRESKKKDKISQARSSAGKKGMESRWSDDNKSITKGDNKKITKITTPIPSPSSSPTVTPKDTHKELHQKIISYLNEKIGKTGKGFRLTTESTIKLLDGRINEGRTFEDFKHVIDVKVEEWKDDEKMKNFLRPDTLFRPSKFESYLNQDKILSKKEKIEESYKKQGF